MLKALVDQVSLAQSHGSPILVQASITSKYCPSAAYNNIWPRSAVPELTPCNTPATTSGQNIKCNPATPEGGQSRDTNKHPKKKRQELSSNPSRVDKKSMGMFYLRNPDMRVGEVFPKDRSEKVCVDYTCKGREYTKVDCTLLHP